MSDALTTWESAGSNAPGEVALAAIGDNGLRMRNVYVIEITSKWYPLVAEGLPPGKRCYYVGETGKDLSERYKEHRTGRSKGDERFNRSGEVFITMRKAQGGKTLRRNIDTMLRRSLTEIYEAVESTDDSVELERQLNNELRSKGHAVYPVNDGDISFEHYRH